jgi:cell division septation protein DedD
VIDLSKAAAIELDLIRSGTSKVRLEVVKPEDIPTEPLAGNEQPQSESTKPAVEEVLTPKGGQNAPPTPPVVEPKKQAVEEATAKTVVKPEKSTSEPANATPIALPVAFNPAEYEPSDLLEFKLNKPEKKGFGVQIAVLSSDEALFKMIGEMEEDWFSSILVMVQQDAKEMSTYKLILGPFDTEEAASNYKDNLKKNKKMDGFVVDLAGLDAKK